MTREEALVQLRLGPGINEDVSEEYNEAVNMAIEALKTQPSEDEKVIRISKGTLKARTGKYVIYDVEWLKEHFNTTEAKIYGQASEDWNAVLDELNRIGRNAFKDDTDYDNLFDFISNLPNVKPQPEERTEERTETHECDCISRQAVINSLHSYFADGFDSDKWWNSTHVLNAINKVPSVTPQPKTGHWIWCASSHKCSNCGGYVCFSHKKLLMYCPNCGAKMQEEKK